MPTNEERREVAARLRSLDASKWSCFGQEFDALMIASLMTACGCNFGQCWQDMELTDRLADLIEPEPESTCNLIDIGECDFECSECGAQIETVNSTYGYPNVLVGGFNYCPNCGAKVVE